MAGRRGQNINIWTDPWMLRDNTRRPITPRGRNILTTVDELIDPITGQWDVYLLNQTFREEDVQIIKSISVHVEMEDVIGWHYDNKGQFSVKSAYKVHRWAVLRGQRRNSGSASGEARFCNKLWNVDCPPKVKHFLWRLSHNTLAMRRVLQRRGMKLDTKCCMCGRLDEDGGHLLLNCKEVKKVWRELNLESTRCKLAEGGSAREMVEAVLNLKEKDRLTVIMLLSLWWGERNKWREEGRRRTAVELAYIAAIQADSVSKTESRLLPDFRQRQSWRKPMEGELKLNTDGAFDSLRKDGGWAMLSVMIKAKRYAQVQAGRIISLMLFMLN